MNKLISNYAIKKTINYGYRVYQQFVEDGCMYRAAALTYTTLLSLAPLMTVALFVLSLFPFFDNMSGEIQDFILHHFVATSGQIVDAYLNYFIMQTKKLSYVGFIFLVVSAILMLYNLEEALNHIWHVKQRRTGFKAILMYIMIVIFAPMLIALSIIMTTYFFSIGWLSHVLLIGEINKILNISTSFFFTFITFLFCYLIIPNAKNSFKNSFIGSLVAGLLFEFAKYGFGFYIRHFTSYLMLYGALSALPVFLIWLYISWIIVLLGGVIVYQLSLEK